VCLGEITGSDKASGVKNGKMRERESERVCMRVNTGPGAT